jgi:hypothetical protein
MLTEIYRARGGNRVLEDKVFDHFASTDVEQITRETVINAARKLYPKHSQALRAELVTDPMDEILGHVIRASRGQGKLPPRVALTCP